MRGANPIRPPVSGGGESLEIKKIFPTLQGEGMYAGWPAVFVRLGGCNLACNFCDTEFEEFDTQPLEGILADIKKHSLDTHGKRVRGLVVITGGEPLRQPIAPLCTALLADGFKVQLETNGTLYRKLPEGVDIICSPKNTGMGYYPLRQDLLQRINALKFIVSHRHPLYKTVGEVGQSTHHIPVYVQPMDEYDVMANAMNLAYAVSLAEQHGYRLSLQTHKIIGVE